MNQTVSRAVLGVSSLRSRRSLVPVLDQGVSSFSNFAVMATGVALSLNDFGALAIAVAVYAVAIGFIRAAILEPATAGRCVAKLGRRLTGQVFMLASLVAAAPLLGAAVASGVTSRVLVVLGVSLPLLAVQDAGRYASFARDGGIRALLADCIWLGVFLTGTSVLFALSAVHVELLFTIWAIAGTASIAVFAPLLFARARAERRLLSADAAGFTIDFLLGAALLQISQLALVAIVSVGDYGRLRAATTVMAPVTVLFTAIASAMLASAVREHAVSPATFAAWIRRVRHRLFSFVLAYSTIAIIGVFVLGDVSPRPVRAALELLPVVAVGNLILSIDMPLVLEMKARGRQALLARARVVQAATAPLALVAASVGGITAGTWALSVSIGAGHLARRQLNRRAVEQRLHHAPLDARPEVVVPH